MSRSSSILLWTCVFASLQHLLIGVSSSGSGSGLYGVINDYTFIHELWMETNISEVDSATSYPVTDSGIEFIINIQMHLNLSDLSAPSDAVLVVTLPHQTIDINNCGSLIDGTSFNCSDSDVTVVYADIDPYAGNISLGSNLIPDNITFNSWQEDEELYFAISNISPVSDSPSLVSGGESYINVTFPVALNRLGYSDTFDFRADLYIEGTANATSITVKRLGTFLSLYTTPSVSEFGSGDTFSVDFELEHAWFSTSKAENVSVSYIAFDEDQVPLTGDPTIQCDSGETFILTGSDVIIGEFNLTERCVATVERKAKNVMEIGRSATTYISVNYDGFTDNYVDVVNSASLDFTAAAGDQPIPSQMVIGETVEIVKQFTSPKGRIAGFEFFIDWDYAGYGVDPTSVMSITNAELTTNDATVTIPSPVINRRKRDTDGADKPLSKHRSKRALTSSTTVNFGNIQVPTAGATFIMRLSLTASPSALIGVFGVVAGFTYGQSTDYMTSATLSLAQPEVEMSLAAQVIDTSVIPNKIQVNASLRHTSSSQGVAFDVTLTIGDLEWIIYWGDDYEGPALNDPELVVTDNKVINWQRAVLNNVDEMFISFLTAPSKDGKYYTDISYIDARLLYFSTDHAGAVPMYQYGTVCIDKDPVIEESVWNNYGYTALAVICGLILGALIVILIIFIIYKIRRQAPFSSSAVRPASAIDTKTLQQTNKGLILDPKSGYKSMKDSGSSFANESIVYILALKDKFKIFRQLDNLDIEQTIKVDQDIENERDAAMTRATILLTQSLANNGDVPKGVQEKSTAKFQNNLKGLEKNLDSEFQKEMDKILKHLSAKNREKLATLMERQDEDREAMEEKTKNMNQSEKNQLRKMLDDEHNTERNELTYMLKLEQDEETEKLRKEYSVRRRMGIKGLQQDYLEDLCEQGRLSEEQADWLMKEHAQNQASIEKMYDEEISRQRMILEEKLAKRRALAEAKELQDDNDSEILNTLAGQQMQLIQKARKDNVLSESEAERLLEESTKLLVENKNRLDADRMKQEEALHKKLSERKRQRLDEQAKIHKQELAELEKKLAGKNTDPLQVIESQQTMLSHQRAEMSDVENRLDMEHAEELDKLREDMVHKTRDELDKEKDGLQRKLLNEGMSNDQLNKILNKHEKDMARLAQTQEEDKLAQMENFKKRLARNRKEMAQRRQDEQEEQAALRDHEDNVVRQLMDNQVALSEDERSKILQEHEKQMVKLENSLTLNKLQSKRMLEEKMARKRAQQMEMLEKKQAKEEQKGRYGDGESDDEVDHEKQIKLMKKHAEQRMAILQGEKIEIEDEMDQIREGMMKDRANALKEQEVKLGAMLAQLQMEKAKEMSRIEEQQKAIHNLKTNLMDDLNEKGILSDPDCQKVIQIHQKEQEKLNSQLDGQRSKQEKALQRKLQERLQQKQEHLSRMHAQQVADVEASSPSSMAAKLRKAALMSKHMMEREQFSNRMEKEIGQTLEEMRRQQDMRRVELLQEQEIQFINGLVRMGKFAPAELDSVVGMLFPNKPAKERQLLLSRLLEGAPVTGNVTDDSTLEERVRHATMATVAREASLLYSAGDEERTPRSLPKSAHHQMVGGKPRRKLSLLSNDDLKTTDSKRRRSAVPGDYSTSPRRFEDYTARPRSSSHGQREDFIRASHTENHHLTALDLPEKKFKSGKKSSFARPGLTGYDDVDGSMGRRPGPSRLPPMEPLASKPKTKKKKKVQLVEDGYYS